MVGSHRKRNNRARFRKNCFDADYVLYHGFSDGNAVTVDYSTNSFLTWFP